MSPLRTEFFNHLRHKRNELGGEVTEVMRRHGAASLGHILEPVTAIDCVRQLGRLGLAITTMGFWCNCTPENAAQYGCPHGGGGYRHERGYFSEHHEYFDVEARGVDLAVGPADYTKTVGRCNAMVMGYLTRHFTSEPFYSPCLYVSLHFP